MFSHYTYIKSGKQLMVLDIQGAGYSLCDPEILQVQSLLTLMTTFSSAMATCHKMRFIPLCHTMCAINSANSFIYMKSEVNICLVTMNQFCKLQFFYMKSEVNICLVTMNCYLKLVFLRAKVYNAHCSRF